MTRHIAPTALLALLVACSTDDGPGPEYTDCRYDIVTYLGLTDAGDEHFELLGRDDAEPLTLIAPRTRADDGGVADGSVIGRRVLLRYAPAGTPAGGVQHITAYAASAITSDSLRYNLAPVAQYLQDNTPVRLASLWRTGDYLNVHCQVEYTGRNRLFYLLLDRDTRQADTAHCYLVHNTLTDSVLHWRECYASFYIGALWQRPTCRVLRVHIDDALRPDAPWHDFTKQ